MLYHIPKSGGFGSADLLAQIASSARLPTRQEQPA